MRSTTSGLYVSHRGQFHYVASWEFAGRNLKWTAVVSHAADTSKLLVGEMQLEASEASLVSLVRRDVEERIDRAAWAE
jgi:hypothetical protein